MSQQPLPLKQQLVFALAILHDVGKTGFLDDAEHEERAGKLVKSVLEHIKIPLDLDTNDILLGRALIENHTMLGTLVQGERSAHEVHEWLQKSINPPLSQEMFLSYLLLLNSMDVSGYRYMPVILDHYWIERYIELSENPAVKSYADKPIKFAKRRLCELARKDISDVGDDLSKEDFHQAVLGNFGKLDQNIQNRIGTMWIRDALYFIMRVNEMGTSAGNWNEEGGWSEDYASCYVNFFEALARIAIKANSETVAFRKGDNPDPKKGIPNGLEKLLERLKDNSNVDAGTFQKEENENKVEFTINEEGLLVGLSGKK